MPGVLACSAQVLWLQEGKDYLAAMSCAANYAWVNRSSMTFLVRQAFQKMFKQQADDLDMHVVYDVSHNIAKACVLSQWPLLSLRLQLDSLPAMQP